MFNRDLVASVVTRFLAAAWINGRDIVYGHDLVSLVSSRVDVATTVSLRDIVVSLLLASESRPKF